MNNKPKQILLTHGAGGNLSRELVEEVFAKHFLNKTLNEMGDSAVLDFTSGRLAFTTDSFVVKPLKFPGGDIGKLAIAGTVNDLSVAGAKPLYISAGFIIEEGLDIAQLEEIVTSMASAAKEAGVMIVTGDTKVVEKGSADKLFINTAGIGKILVKEEISTSRIEEGDAILINGPIADHGMAIMTTRGDLSIRTEIISDCASLNSLIGSLIETVSNIHFMRDATRGGLATVLNEAIFDKALGIEIDETQIKVRPATQAACELLGIDPLYVANEGKLVAFVAGCDADKALACLRSHPLGKDASIIGRVTKTSAGKVILNTSIATKRIIPMLSGDPLPRIC